jgi:hypothetical protein
MVLLRGGVSFMVRLGCRCDDDVVGTQAHRLVFLLGGAGLVASSAAACRKLGSIKCEVVSAVATAALLIRGR